MNPIVAFKKALARAMNYTDSVALGGGAVQGPQGPRGEKGEPGPAGAQGAQRRVR